MVTLITDYGPNDARSLSGGLNASNTIINQLNEGTGWRNIASLLVSGSGTATNVQIIRRGAKVTVRALRAATTSLNWIAGLPTGWRPAANTSKKVLGVDLIIGSAGSINFLANVTLSDTTWIEFEYEASGAFPTANLPGIAI